MAKEEQIKSQIILDGEKEYRDACKAINSSLREIGSEMKLTTAEFADNANGVEALTAKQKQLQKQFDEQTKKAEAAEKALEKMRKAGIEPTSPAYQKMQTNLNNTRADMVKIQREIDDTSKKLKGSKIDWKSVGDAAGNLGTVLGKTAKTMGKACAVMGAAIAAVGAAIIGIAEETRETRENMGKLETSFTTAGHSAEDAKGTYAELYGVLGDDGQATEAAAHLAKLTTNEKELSDWTNICTGVYATFGDSLPIEGLTEAANETAKTGSITGNLADALNWAGVSEDDFQSKLDACSSEQERQALITSTLNGLYSEAADKYKEVNGDIIDAQKATANLNNAMAELGAIAEPIVTKLKQLAAELLQEITPFVELLGNGFTGLIDGANDAANQLSEGLLGIVNLLVEKVLSFLPTFIEIAAKMIQTLVEGIIDALPTLIPAAIQVISLITQTLIDNIPLLLNAAGEVISQLATGIGKALPSIIPAIVQIIVQIVQALLDNMPLLVDAALQIIVGFTEGIINAIPVLVAALPQLITSLINGLLGAIPQIIQAGITLLTALIGALPEIITAIIQAIPQIVTGIVTALTENIPLIIQAGIDLLVALIGALPDIITAIVQAIPQIISGIVTALTENIPLIIQAGIDLLVALIGALPDIITAIVQAIPQIISGIVDALIGNIDKIILAGVQLFVALIENLPTIIVEIVKAIPEIIVGIVDAIGGLAYKLVEAGGNLLKGLWEGISNAASWLWEKVSGWASSLVDGIKDFFGIHSPSTVFADIGGNMADGVGVGFTDNMSGVESDMTTAMGGAGDLTAQEAVDAVNNGISSNIDRLSGAINAIVERVITGLTAQSKRLNQAGQDFDKHTAQGMISGIPQLTSKVSQIVQPIITSMRSFVSQFREVGKEMVRGIWQGFQSMSEWLETKVRSMMKDIVTAVREEMKIESPSKVFAGIGAYMAQGLGEGFAHEMRDVEKTIRRETSNTVPNYRDGKDRRTQNRETPTVEVVQNIYANGTSYAQQQREAARQFRQIAREVMA